MYVFGWFYDYKTANLVVLVFLMYRNMPILQALTRRSVAQLPIWVQLMNNCCPDDQMLSPSWLSPDWFVAQLTFAQLVCRPVDW